MTQLEQQAIDALVSSARRSIESSHSPYSGFRVGAALLTASGETIGGCNVENASYGLTICAERTAIVKAVSEGVRDLRAIAIVTDGREPTMPCGACRQVLAEFAGDELTVIVESASAKRVVCTLGELLPQSFRPSDLRDA